MTAIDASTTKISATVGQEVTIKLPAGATSGYRWEAIPTTEPVRIEQRPFERTSPSRNFGGSGVEQFVVVPLAAGSITLRFDYKRPWESTPAKSAYYELDVQ